MHGTSTRGRTAARWSAGVVALALAGGLASPGATAAPVTLAPAALPAATGTVSGVRAPAARTVLEDGTTVLTGGSASGATWEARVPVEWNGTVVLYGHGFRGPGANPAWDSRMDPTFEQLMDRGYAVVSSSYSTVLWALGTAVDDQLDALMQFGEQYAHPQRTIAYGRSMGGLVTGLIAEVPNSGVDGAVATCGLMHGGVGLNNYQLDAAHAAAELLVGDSDLRLTGFRTPADSAETIAAIRAAIEQAQATPEGRARLALVGLYLHVPTEIDGVDPKDPVALAEAQAPLISSTLIEVISRRSGIVPFADGDSGWTQGVDYRALFNASGQKQTVASLYRAAGLDLKADLDTLTRAADIAPDEGALEWMRRTSQPTGEIQIPVFSTHTLNDLLAPVEVQEEYAETVRRAGNNSLLRQAYTDRVGHCVYSVAETVASIELMDERLDTGRWGNTTAKALDARTEALGLDGGNWVSYRPEEFVADRTWQ